MTTWLPVLAQGSAGVALVIGFALLCVRHVGVAFALLAVQSAAAALGALAWRQPLFALPPAIFTGGILLASISRGSDWFGQRQAATDDRFMPATRSGHYDLGLSGARPASRVRNAFWREHGGSSAAAPVGGAKLGVAVGAALAILGQSQGLLALPLTIVLLSALLAATRSHATMRMVALVGLQNGLVLSACVVFQPQAFPIGISSMALPVACLALPLPLLLGTLSPSMKWRGPFGAAWIGWLDLGASIVVLASALAVPLDLPMSIFAPLLGLDGVLRSCARRKRHHLTYARRGFALLSSTFIVAAACAPDLVLAWLGMLAALATALWPSLGRRPNNSALAFTGAGIALFGLLVLSGGPYLIGYFSLFAGLTAVVAAMPDLVVVATIMILRLANQGPWPEAAKATGTAIALAALLASALLLSSTLPASSEWGKRVSAGSLPPTGAASAGNYRVTLLALGQASIALLSICAGQDDGSQSDGRFAALVLLVLLTLTRSAIRVPNQPVATLATAGLGGVPPFGVFPGVALVVLALGNHAPWLLLPLGIAMVPILLAALPQRAAATPAASFLSIDAIKSVGWIPLALAALIGYFMPDRFVHWWHVLTAGLS